MVPSTPPPAAAPIPSPAGGGKPSRRWFLAYLVPGLVIFGLAVGLSLYVYPQLPAEIPVHFGADGLPNRSVGKSVLNWLLLPLAGLGLGTFMLLSGYGALRLGRRRTWLLNVPLKREFLKLAPEAQAPVWREYHELFWALWLFLQLFFAALQCLIYYAALDQQEQRLPLRPFFAVLGGFVVAMLYFSLVPLLRMRSLIRRATAAAAAERETGKGRK